MNFRPLLTITWICAVVTAAMLCGCAEPHAQAKAQGAETPSQTPLPRTTVELTEWVSIPAGIHRPLYPGKNEPKEVPVQAFLLEQHPVTNAQFLEFVIQNPDWQRSQVRTLFADANYLVHWNGDLEIPPGSQNSPVTNVSWFAARAYANWAGRRLPTLAEWEYVGIASETSSYGRDEEGYNQRILNWYSRPTPVVPEAVLSHPPNYYGVSDMHGLVWEWVDDFNTALVTGESRGDSSLDRNLFCGSGSIGAADPQDYAAFMRFAFRSSLEAHFTTRNQGFRCASDLTTTTPTPSSSSGSTLEQ
jgi:formylglycine-generating enzyme required for sulfatase activity